MKPNQQNPTPTPNEGVPQPVMDTLNKTGEPWILIYGGPKSTIAIAKDAPMPTIATNLIAPVVVSHLQSALTTIVSRMNEESDVATGDGSGQGTAKR